MLSTKKYFIKTMLLLLIFLIGCAENGEEGTTGLDCGDNGAEHDGHCHCFEGYLFDGDSCVHPTQITQYCKPHDEEQLHDDEEQLDAACICEIATECPCDGTIETYENIAYCIPPLH